MAENLPKGDQSTDSPSSFDKVAREPKNEAKISQSLSDEADIVYPSGLKLILLMTSMFIGMFLVSLVCFTEALEMK